MFETPITLDEGATVDGLAKISGFVEVTVQRYLHLSATLWYQSDTLGLSPILLSPEPTDEHSLLEYPDGYFELRESRRMRSEELHYLDHPKFGVIVRIDPLTIPEPLNSQLQTTKQLIDSER